MKKPKMTYFNKNDVLHLLISDENEFNSIELSPNITAELNEKGELIGIEILEASSFIRDSVMESAHAKVLNILSQHNKGLEVDAESWRIGATGCPKKICGILKQTDIIPF